MQHYKELGCLMFLDISSFFMMLQKYQLITERIQWRVHDINTESKL